MTEFCFQQIGVIESCFKQKFSIPRQPGLVLQAKATIILDSNYSSDEIIRGLDSYSHIWVIFVFHKSQMTNNKNTVRPPRLGGDKRMGVFATRSNFRPNPIGQSVVKLEGIEKKNNRLLINLSGIDFLDGTPVLDIKPYIPYVDSIPTASALFAALAPEKIFNVNFQTNALSEIEEASQITGHNILQLIEELLAYDPRPRKIQPHQIYVTRIYNYDLKWQIEEKVATVISLEKKD